MAANSSVAGGRWSLQCTGGDGGQTVSNPLFNRAKSANGLIGIV
jgi:hypothetical protein